MTSYDDSNGIMALHAKERRREEERRDGGEKDGEENGDHNREKDRVREGATVFSKTGRLNECERGRCRCARRWTKVDEGE